ncbi:FAD-dependent oxidoreductase, partial [Streptomyces sp. NPDC059506]|uniref:FAD-dependent oxidoreductase n=1 Tax=Streptomyces sp. NPDC059506 TaxID=3347751 RepID=UPI003681CFB9
ARVLDAGRVGPVGRSLGAGEVAPTRGRPGGGTLVTTTLLGPRGDAELDRTVRDRLAALYGVSTRDWQLLSVRHDPFALPSMSAPHDMHRPVRLLAGLYVCGDHRDTSSAQGALDSGRRAAEQVLRDLGVPPPPPRPPPPPPPPPPAP